MNLGENIYKLRKKENLSQEQLAELIDVTRQTISNWELGSTSPNPEQLKLLSKYLKVSIDELLGNEAKDILVEKISNTEKLVGIIIKILKVFGILFLIYLILIILSFSLFNTKKLTKLTEIECTLNDNIYNYTIKTSKDNKIIETNGSKYIKEILKDKNFTNEKDILDYIENYFNNKGGTCN